MIERLLRDGTVIARSDGTAHDLFPVAVGAAEGEALGEWVVREGATQHHVEESQIALPRFLSEGRRFELAFVGDYQLRRSPVRRRSA